ncbi:glycosyltransferase family 39 protein [Methylobacterium hispanicum]|uniref:ArnT family glycosyltransferase n=1 Tax=Methylobacterium hispanicum TaxID=270350 RepID=UPI002F2C32DB
MTSLSAGRAGAAEPDLIDRLPGLAAATHARACLALLVLALVLFLPGQIGLQPMDRDEPRFAQASKQMLETGDLVDIRFQAEARHKKPVGIYWLQAASVAAGEALGVPGARTEIALYRIPSLVGACAAVLLAYWAALAFLARPDALLAAALFGACLMLSAEARLAKTDALLTACTVASFGALARAWLSRGSAVPLPRSALLAFWGGLALGILVKGPMVPLFVGLPALILSGLERDAYWLRRLRPGLGLALVALAVAPWFLAIAWKSGGAFFTEAVGQDMLAKVGGAKEKHWGPPGTYALAFFGTFWPGAAFAALAIPFAWRARGEDAVALLVAAILPAWAIFECVPTKLPHYVLPLMPMVAILTVLALRRGALDPRRPGASAVGFLAVAIPVGLAVGLPLAGWQLDRQVPWAALPLLAGAVGLALAAWFAFRAHRSERALVLGVLASLLVSPALFGLGQREIPALKVSPRLAAIRDALPCASPRVASLGYREPSLVFLVGTDLATPPTGREASDFLHAGGCRLVFVEARQAAEFAAAEAGRTGARQVGAVSGFNINGGRRVGLAAYAVVP